MALGLTHRERSKLALPEVSHHVLLDALRRFDEELRPTPDWLEWEQGTRHKYAIEHDGRLYPVKQIVSLATGVPNSGFSGGDEANGYVTKRGLKVVSLPSKGEPNVWWVNQGQSYEEAREGGHISAPVVDKRGGEPVHWKTMTEVRVDDLIVHNAVGQIRAIGRAVSEGYLVPRPGEGAGSGSVNQDGALRRVDIEYFVLDPPVSVSAVADRIRALNIHVGPYTRRRRAEAGIPLSFRYRWTAGAQRRFVSRLARMGRGNPGQEVRTTYRQDSSGRGRECLG